MVLGVVPIVQCMLLQGLRVTRFLKHVSVVFKATDSHSIERVLHVFTMLLENEYLRPTYTMFLCSCNYVLPVVFSTKAGFIPHGLV